MLKKREGLSPEELTSKTGGLKSENEIKPDLEKLHAYTKNKLALAGQLRIVRKGLTVLGRGNGERLSGELMVKLAEDRFVLAVLGQYKRGKSSLMNAIIGREILPTGVLPLTSAITVLKYGPTDRLVVSRKDSMFEEELPVASLPDYVTEQGNPSNQKKVKIASLELPVPFLRNGIEFVDTPGVGSAILANTSTTYGFLPDCDAVIFVTSVDMPMTSMELEFLKQIREYTAKIFFVVNKIDLVEDDEQSEILRYIEETIKSQIGNIEVELFPISARLGISSRITGDAILYEQSGLKYLEEALVSFLYEQKSATFLAGVAQKALRILDDEASQNAFNEADSGYPISSNTEENSVTYRQNPHEAIVNVYEARRKLEALYKGIHEGQMIEMPETKPSKGISLVDPTPVTSDMISNLETRGCPVCQHMAKQASDFFARWQYQISTEEQAQEEFAKEMGFCPLHTWQLFAVSSPHGASVGFARVTEHIAHRLKEYKAQAGSGKKVKQLVHNSGSCSVCNILRKVEEKYIRQLSGQLIEADSLRHHYQQSQGVCLRHLSMLLEATSSEDIRGLLISHAILRFLEDAEDMRSFAMKYEALRRGLQNPNEEDAYKRAIIRMVGSRSVCMPWAEDGVI